MTNDCPLSIHDLTVAYQHRPVLWGIDYDTPAGKLIAILGPNGAGKSTLVRATLGLLPVAAGQVQFFGNDFAKVRSRVAYVPQRSSVDWDFPVSALDVVCMGLYRRLGWFRPINRAVKQQAMDALEQVGLADYASRQIRQLSGGQQQRVFIARALVQQADLYLMDEPFAGVDATTERTIVNILQGLKKTGKTALVVHHDLQTVEDYFDDAILLNTRLFASGPIKDVLTPERLRQTFGGKLALLDQVGHRMTLSRSVP